MFNEYEPDIKKYGYFIENLSVYKKDPNKEPYVDPTDTLSWKINEFFFRLSIPFRDFYRGCYNLWIWKSIIWKDRFWDYSFFTTILVFKLEQMEKYWGVDTHHEGDKFTKGRLKVLIKRFKELDDKLDEIDMAYLKGANDEERKLFWKIQMKRHNYLIDQAFKVLGRNHRRFWD